MNKPHRFFVRGKAIMLEHAQHGLTAERVKVAAQGVVLNLKHTTPQRRVRNEENKVAANEGARGDRGCLDVVSTTSLWAQGLPVRYCIIGCFFGMFLTSAFINDQITEGPADLSRAGLPHPCGFQNERSNVRYRDRNKTNSSEPDKNIKIQR